MKPTFVIPWYGADVTGGAETEARKTVEGLQRLAGVEVEVLTTCVQDFHSDWSNNARPAGLEWVDGIPVRRFPVRSRNTKAFDAVNRRLMHGLPLTSEEEAVYMREMIHSPAMYDFISATTGRTAFSCSYHTCLGLRTQVLPYTPITQCSSHASMTSRMHICRVTVRCFDASGGSRFLRRPNLTWHGGSMR